jgi:hypothetical protein
MSSVACDHLRKAENNMSKTLSTLFLLIALAGPALASTVFAVPAAEIDGGVLGLMLAGGVVYLINRRRRNRS